MIQRQIDELVSGKSKGLVVLLDPDKLESPGLEKRIELCNLCKVDFIFLGGSLLNGSSLQVALDKVKALTNIPVILFPGSAMQVQRGFDAILFLSLLSGRNPEFLIGNQVLAAPYIKQLGLEALSTAYLLINSGGQTTASYVSGTTPIPRDKPEIALATSQAAELMGFSNIYLDGGSGAEGAIPSDMIKAVKEHVDLPLIVGGGIRDAKALESVWNAGADLVVVGNAIEDEPALIEEFSQLKYSL